MIGKMNLCLLAVVLCAAVVLARVKVDPLAKLSLDESVPQAERCAQYAAHANETVSMVVPLSEGKLTGALYVQARLAIALSGKPMTAEQTALLADIKSCVPADELKGIDLDSAFN